MKEGFEFQVLSFEQLGSLVGLTRKKRPLLVGERSASPFPFVQGMLLGSQRGFARDCKTKREIALWRSSFVVVFNTAMGSSARICTNRKQLRSKSK
jgi:hypothetical protein